MQQSWLVLAATADATGQICAITFGFGANKAEMDHRSGNWMDCAYIKRRVDRTAVRP